MLEQDVARVRVQVEDDRDGRRADEIADLREQVRLGIVDVLGNHPAVQGEHEPVEGARSGREQSARASPRVGRHRPRTAPA
jgi:hypothetical protein